MGDSTGLRSSTVNRLSLCGIAAFSLVALSGCSVSSVLDAVNPVNWYDDITGDSASDKAAKKNANAAAYAAGADQPYPNLSTVPDEPTNGLTDDEKDKLAQGLLADRQHAHYTDDQIRSGNGAATMPGLADLPQGTQAPTPSGGLVAGGGLAVGGALAAGDALTPDSPRAAPPPPDMKPTPAPVAHAPEAAPPAAGGPVPAAPQQVAEAPVPAAPAPAAPGPSGATPIGKGKTSVAIAQVAFAPGSSALPSSIAADLTPVIVKHQAVGGTIRVIGHAAPAGTGADPAGDKLAAYQAALGRANAIKQALVDAGVAATDIVAEASPGGDSANADRADINVEY